MIATAYFLLADSNPDPDPNPCTSPDFGETVVYDVDGCGFNGQWTIENDRKGCSSNVTVRPASGPPPDVFAHFSGGAFSAGWSSATASYDRSCTGTAESPTLLAVRCDGPHGATCTMTMTRRASPHGAHLADASVDTDAR